MTQPSHVATLRVETHCFETRGASGSPAHAVTESNVQASRLHHGRLPRSNAFPRRALGAALLLALVAPACVQAQTTMWDRRDPRGAYLFHDWQARQRGDVLTIVIDEATGAGNQESRDMEKKTKSSIAGSNKGSFTSTTLGSLLRSFATDFDLELASQRKFDGTNNSIITRNFTDKLTVVVIDVLPNGFLVVEGYRSRMIARELRTLRIQGIVRPVDIGPFNTVQSQFIANLQINYFGRGPESNYTNQGWGGRIFNKLWPF